MFALVYQMAVGMEASHSVFVVSKPHKLATPHNDIVIKFFF